jgi:hypothetical protein
MDLGRSSPGRRPRCRSWRPAPRSSFTSTRAAATATTTCWRKSMWRGANPGAGCADHGRPGARLFVHRHASIWHSWAYRIQDASGVELLRRLTRTYQLVEGTVHAAGEGHKWIYVNFAEDWRHDFTIAIAQKDRAAFETAGLDLERLPGKRVRVRGWVEGWKGGNRRDPPQTDRGAGVRRLRSDPRSENGPAMPPGHLQFRGWRI